MRVRKQGNEEVVDLAAEETVDISDSKPQQMWGQPAKCPECGERGYLDHIDMIDRVMFQHCTECAHKWTTAQTETVQQSF